MTDKTLEECKALCDENSNCSSFAYSSLGHYKGSCVLKDKNIQPNEAQKVATGFQTYYKSCNGKIIDLFRTCQIFIKCN